LIRNVTSFPGRAVRHARQTNAKEMEVEIFLAVANEFSLYTLAKT
jgi:hypothetical protein